MLDHGVARVARQHRLAALPAEVAQGVVLVALAALAGVQPRSAAAQAASVLGQHRSIGNAFVSGVVAGFPDLLARIKLPARIMKPIKLTSTQWMATNRWPLLPD